MAAHKHLLWWWSSLCTTTGLVLALNIQLKKLNMLQIDHINHTLHVPGPGSGAMACGPGAMVPGVRLMFCGGRLGLGVLWAMKALKRGLQAVREEHERGTSPERRERACDGLAGPQELVSSKAAKFCSKRACSKSVSDSVETEWRAEPTEGGGCVAVTGTCSCQTPVQLPAWQG